MILNPSAAREHGAVDSRRDCHFGSRPDSRSAADLEAAAQRGRARYGRKDWLAGMAVLGLVAGLSAWLIGDGERNGVALFATPHLVEPAEAGALTTTGAGADVDAAGIAPMPNLGAIATRIAINPLRAVDVRILQIRLTEMGFEPGYVDGVAGGRTLDALNRYRDSLNLPPVGAIDYGTVGGLLD